MNKLRKSGIITQVHYIPVPMHPYYRKLGFHFEQYKNALAYYQECLSIPVYYSLSSHDQQYVIDRVKDALLTG